MRVLLAAPPSPARLHNLVPLAWALRTAGHDVKIAGQASFVDEILRTGCVAVDLGTEDTESAALTEFAELWRPDVVVADAQAPAAGAGTVRLLGPLDESGPAGFDTVPPSLRDSSDARPVRHVPYFGPVVVPEWLRRKARRSRVLLSLTDATLAGPVFDALAGLAAEVVWATDAAEIPAGVTMPPNVRLVDTAPPAALLPTCSAVVHDGDASLALAAATHGVPQLSLTETAIGARIAAAGAGFVGSADGVAELASLSGAATALRDEIAALPAPRELVAALTR
ncbi:nucleotide disphospho-sugar-binding domain-containing protein [Amycolatopsis sp. RTGN1]|uniref:nucleotide disphospho-sugar-binding domain-containing protein n=1 Tax=Amycolatopsis ponsaeliensis TaxID=2992142 RepID=UPI00254B7CA7|nr:nucleotide disphospho-sugar-binding domain-containing protein [Amycolatopsis sp. RTGN1]